MNDDNFLSRWSRRKALVRQGVEPAPAAAPSAVVPLPLASTRPSGAVAVENPVTGGAEDGRLADPVPADADSAAKPAAVAQPVPPTLDDVAALTPESDFSRFVGRDVDAQVKNSAMKKLFSDPHYNVMDGLDTYIDDYNTPDPLPKAMLRQLVQARTLGLLDDEMPEQPAAVEMAAEAHQPESVAQAGGVQDDAPADAVAAIDGGDAGDRVEPLPTVGGLDADGVSASGSDTAPLEVAEERGSRTHPGPLSGPTRFCRPDAPPGNVPLPG